MKSNTPQKRVLVTSARFLFCLDLVRQLHAAGHTVYTADPMRLTLCRFSNAVKKSFKVPPPRTNPQKFIDALIRIINEEQIDFLLPTFEDIFYISKALDQFPKHCEVFCSSHKTLTHLHNKWLFYQMQLSHALRTIPTVLIQSEEALQHISLEPPYVIKPCFTRGSQACLKIENGINCKKLPLNDKNPLIAQKWIKGKEYSSYSVCYEGKLYAHTTYPVEFVIGGNCITFKAIEHPAIYAFVKMFIEKEQYTGQIAFDFIEDEKGMIFCIECNPRTTSGVHLFNGEDWLADAFFHANTKPAIPPVNRSKQPTLAMLIWGWRNRNPSLSFGDYLKKLFYVQDVVFTSQDLKPFLMEPILFSIYYTTSLRKRLSLPASFTLDLEWNG